MENLKIRTIIAFILAPITFFLIWIGGIPFLLLCILVLSIGALEFGNMFATQPENQNVPVFLAALTAVQLLSRFFVSFENSSLVLILSIFMCGIWGVVSFEKGNRSAANGFAVMVSGLVYFGWIGGYLVSLRDVPDGLWWVMLCLLLIWTTDTGAFFIGSLIGRHHMLPAVSPRKTWEGYFGGIISCLVIGFLLHRIFPFFGSLMTVSQILLLSLIVSAVGSVGDFVESMIKRTFKAKDTSNLIPGHGGFFDRLDTVLWVIPIGYFCYRIF